MLWIVLILVGFVFFNDSSGISLVIPGVFLLLHCAEIPVSLKIGKTKGLSTATVVANTLIFGFTWWVPVKMGVFDL